MKNQTSKSLYCLSCGSERNITDKFCHKCRSSATPTNPLKTPSKIRINVVKPNEYVCLSCGCYGVPATKNSIANGITALLLIIGTVVFCSAGFTRALGLISGTIILAVWFITTIYSSVVRLKYCGTCKQSNFIPSTSPAGQNYINHQNQPGAFDQLPKVFTTSPKQIENKFAVIAFIVVVVVVIGFGYYGYSRLNNPITETEPTRRRSRSRSSSLNGDEQKRIKFASGLNNTAKQNGKKSTITAQGDLHTTLYVNEPTITLSECGQVAKSDWGGAADSVGFKVLVCENSHGDKYTEDLSTGNLR